MTRQARMTRLAVPLLSLSLPVAACGGSSDDEESSGTAANGASTAPDRGSEGQRFPDVVDVQVERDGDSYDFAVTISSPYDSPERYADGWRIVGEEGTVYGEHELGHDHADEQPFTRTQPGVEIPAGVEEVTVEGHDLVNGYGGETMTVAVPDD